MNRTSYLLAAALFLCVILGITSLILNSNKNAIVHYAKVYQLTVVGEPDFHGFGMGPFNFRSNGDQIWSLAVKQGNTDCTLWVRFSLFDSVYLVYSDNKEVCLK